MPYFFIALAFALYLLLGGLFLLVARFTELGRPVFPFAWRLFACSAVGVVVANLVFMTAVVLFVNDATFSGLGTAMRNVVGVTTGLGIILGPFLATGLGLVGGGIFGLMLALKARRVGRGAPA